MRVLDSLLIDVGVNLGGGNVSVAEHFLNDAQVGAVVEKMCGETVAERVGREMFGDTGAMGVLPDESPN